MSRYYVQQPDVLFQLERQLGIGFEDNLVAHAGGGQASATPLSGNVLRHIFRTVTSPNDSGALPLATSDQVGLRHSVKNMTSNSMQLYGQGTDTIDDVAFGTGIALTAGQGMTFECFAAGKWYRIGN